MTELQFPFPSDLAPPSDAESLLWQSVSTGSVAEVEEDWPPVQKVIRAPLIVRLLLGGPSVPPIHPKGIRICGAEIEQHLDLENVTSPSSLYLLGCRVHGTIDLRCATLPRVYLAGTSVSKLLADSAQFVHGLHARDGSEIEDLSCRGATVGNILDLVGSKFGSIHAERLQVNGSVALHSGVRIKTVANFLGASVSGRFDASASSFQALLLSGLKVGQTMYVNDGFTAETLDLSSADLAAGLIADHSTIGEVSLDFANLGQGLDLGEEVQITRRLSCFRTNIAGSFNATGAKIEQIHAEACQIEGDLFLHQGFVANQFLHFRGAKVQGQVSLVNAKIPHLDLEAAMIGSHFILRENSPVGTLILATAKIEGAVEIAPDQASGPDRQLIAAIAATIGSTARIRIPEGAYLDLSQAEINGQLDLDAAKDTDADLSGLRSTGFAPQSSLLDEPTADIRLNGFVYSSIVTPTANPDPTQLNRFLQRADEGRMLPQPYQQLVRALQLQGYQEESVEVAIASRRALRHDRESDDRSLKSKLATSAEWLILDLALGYGYRPQRSVWLAVAAVLAGTVVYTIAGLSLMAPAQADILADWKGPYPVGYPRFTPFVYALDRVLPIVELGQVAHYQPNMESSAGRLLMAFDWILNLAGWIVTSLVVTAFSGIVKKAGPESAAE